MEDLYSTDNERLGEVAMCNLAAIVVANIKDDEEYAKVAYYALMMIDKTIHLADYPLKHVEVTAKSRLNAGVGIMGLAHYMAKNKVKYTTDEGKKEIDRLSERHAWHLINASLELSKKYGVAPWMNRTKWPEGWLPIDTYNRNVDGVITHSPQYDWEGLRSKIVENGGIRNSSLINHMPGESCLHEKQKIKTSIGDISMREIFDFTGIDFEEAVLEYDKFKGGQWYSLKTPISVKTRFGMKEVERIWYNGHTNYMTITMENGDIIKCTHHHKFLVKDIDGNKKWKMAIELEEDDDIVTHMP
jgi:hypothetical protein